MPKSLKVAYRLGSAAIFILLEVAALSLLKNSATLQDIWINRTCHFVMGRLWSSGESLRNHFSLEKQNEALYLENHRLSEELRIYKSDQESRRENAATVSFHGRFSYIPATVVKISRNSAHNYIILNKGREDGVQPYSGIITSKGIVGIISAVGNTYSYGLTLMNSNISVSARVGRAGMVGPVVWNGKNSDRAILKNLPLHSEINAGDTLFTSGYSTIFPADIPIGVAGKTSIEDGSTLETEVALFQDFSVLRYVTIVQNPERSEIEMLEKMSRQ